MDGQYKRRRDRVERFTAPTGGAIPHGEKRTMNDFSKPWDWKPPQGKLGNPNVIKATPPPPSPFDLMHKIKLLKEENVRLREEIAELRLNK